ncbi:MAG TPA: methyltransferase domain-containing protein, partial [Pirellulales bacterium]
VFAEDHPSWRFLGVDPSSEMLKLARETVGPLASRITFHEGYIDAAPVQAFDGATCLLTLHFLPLPERLRTLTELHKRLKPGAPLVVAHHSFSQEPDAKTLWLSRYAAFAAASGVESEKTRSAAAAIGERLPVLSPEQDESLLREAGFSNVTLFYAAFTFRGWVAFKDG